MANMNALCLNCGEASLVDTDTPLPGCPKCGDTGFPADLDKSLQLRITEHEL